MSIFINGLVGSNPVEISYDATTKAGALRLMALKNQASELSDATEKKSSPRKRRTQAERSSDTRKRVCQATLQALIEIGYERISTQEIATRAKVSRGALTHQFPTRNELIVAAFDYLMRSWENDWPFDDAQNRPSMKTDELIDVLWEKLFEPDKYMAALELMLAARLDDDLGRDLRNTMARWTTKRDNIIAEILGVSQDCERTRTFIQINLCMLRGLAVHKSFDNEPDVAKRML
ncbi:MAG TPA: hypothetical protein DD465_08385, partial [Thalassospira sp.]|nr:hypothetical protein [Thalassospira sp.]